MQEILKMLLDRAGTTICVCRDFHIDHGLKSTRIVEWVSSSSLLRKAKVSQLKICN